MIKLCIVMLLVTSCHGPFWGRSRRRHHHGHGHHHLIDKTYCDRYEGQERLDCQDKQEKYEMSSL